MPNGTSPTTHIASYRRRLPVNLQRMYENALDWEHLPWQHSGSFKSIQVLDSGHWGWRADVELQPVSDGLSTDPKRWLVAFQQSLRQPLRLGQFALTTAQQLQAARRGVKVTLELRLDREAQRWITTTLSGPGKGTQIWTHVFERDDQALDIVVDFFIPGVPDGLAPLMGEFYQTLYQQLYDEDVAMMVRREQALTAKKAAKTLPDATAPLCLGSIADPQTLFTHAGRRWRLHNNADGAGMKGETTWLAFAADCPHMLGPLSEVPVQDGRVQCPWHGYVFDVQTGDNCSGQRCRLPTAPVISESDGELWAGAL